MAEQIISPGVFTRENDLSFLPAGVASIGAAIIGPTVKGPAFIPTVVRSFAEYERRFGPLSEETYVPQTVREYLRNAGSVTVCRVLAGGGYTFTSTSSPAYVVAGQAGVGNSSIGTGFIVENYQPSKAMVVAAIYPSKNSATPDLAQSEISSVVNSATISGSAMSGSFKIILSGSQGGSAITSGTSFSASFDPSRTDYLFNQLGSNPNNIKVLLHHLLHLNY